MDDPRKDPGSSASSTGEEKTYTTGGLHINRWVLTGNDQLDVNIIAERWNIETPAGIEALRVAIENIQLLDRKQKDYGPANIAKFGANGCLVRMSDKYERLVNLFKKKRNIPQNESIQDSFKDLSNYAIIALLCLRGKWPKE